MWIISLIGSIPIKHGIRNIKRWELTIVVNKVYYMRYVLKIVKVKYS